MGSANFYLERGDTPVPIRVRGRGPGVILVPGGFQTAADFDRLAEHLAGSFTTIVLERRGRGASRNLAAQASLDAEANDVLHVAKAIEAHHLFGHSSGALICLRAAEVEPNRIHSMALHEPPLVTQGYEEQFSWTDEVAQLIETDQNTVALARMISVVLFHGALKRRPNLLLRAAAAIALRWGHGAAGEPLVELLPTFRQDAQIVRESRYTASSITRVKARTLLMSGSRVDDALAAALVTLNRDLPQSKRLELRGVGHLAPTNMGKPRLVAKQLALFFSRS